MLRKLTATGSVQEKGIEVLLMSERVDEWAMNFVHEFDGTPLQNVSKGAVDLGDLQDAEEKHLKLLLNSSNLWLKS